MSLRSNAKLNANEGPTGSNKRRIVYVPGPGPGPAHPNQQGCTNQSKKIMSRGRASYSTLQLCLLRGAVQIERKRSRTPELKRFGERPLRTERAHATANGPRNGILSERSDSKSKASPDLFELRSDSKHLQNCRICFRVATATHLRTHPNPLRGHFHMLKQACCSSPDPLIPNTYH